MFQGWLWLYVRVACPTEVSHLAILPNLLCLEKIKTLKAGTCKILVTGLIFALMPLSLELSSHSGFGLFNVPTAEAKHRRDHFDRDHLDRGELRRTIRRIDRRIDRRTQLPAGCIRALINDIGYWRCGSIFYREILDNNVKVFIVVEP